LNLEFQGVAQIYSKTTLTFHTLQFGANQPNHAYLHDDL